MNKALTEKQLDHLLEFIGYGRLDADIWFLEMEETGGSEDNIHTRLKLDQVEDLYKAQQTIGAVNLPGNQRGMCEIMLRLDDNVPDDEMIQTYQTERLGRRHGSTLLCFLMPIPRSANQEWDYNTILPQFESHQACYEAIKPERMNALRQLVDESKPKIVIGCGKEHWDEYQELFNQFKFSANDEFLVGWDTDTVVILTDQLDAPSMEGKFSELVTIIRENALNIDTSVHSDIPIISEAELKRQKKGAARQAAVAKRKPSTTHDPADPYCVCAYCLRYEGVK